MDVNICVLLSSQCCNGLTQKSNRLCVKQTLTGNSVPFPPSLSLVSSPSSLHTPPLHPAPSALGFCFSIKQFRITHNIFMGFLHRVQPSVYKYLFYKGHFFMQGVNSPCLLKGPTTTCKWFVTACISTHCLLQPFSIRFVHAKVTEPLALVSAHFHAHVQRSTNNCTAVAAQESGGVTGCSSSADPEAHTKLFLSSPAQL